MEITTWGSPPRATLATCRSSISTLLLPFPLRQYAANSSPSSSTSFLGSASTAATAAAAAAAAAAPDAGTTSGVGRRRFSAAPLGTKATAAAEVGWGGGDGETSSRSSARSAKGRSGEPAAAAGAGAAVEAGTVGSGEAEAALQESGRREGEKTGELGMATVQDIARRRPGRG
jgi:hypothetical protein